MMFLTRAIVFICCFSMVLSGCAGRTAHPVHTHRHSDETMSCQSLISEMTEIDGAISNLLPKENKTGKNVALGVAGAFFIVPWFFMDFSDAERTEINAYRSRYNHLTRIYNDKKCGVAKQEIPAFTAKAKKANK